MQCFRHVSSQRSLLSHFSAKGQYTYLGLPVSARTHGRFARFYFPLCFILFCFVCWSGREWWGVEWSWSGVVGPKYAPLAYTSLRHHIHISGTTTTTTVRAKFNHLHVHVHTYMRYRLPPSSKSAQSGDPEERMGKKKKEEKKVSKPQSRHPPPPSLRFPAPYTPLRNGNLFWLLIGVLSE